MHTRAWALAALLSGSAAAAPIDLSPVPQRDPGSPLAPGWQHGAFMEIFVRAWRDSDGDGIGDLPGLTQTLPYLKDLGVKGLWLMPITANADGDHGYATTDHRAIAPEYGTLADFDAMLAAAHQLGIGVIMDYVINHSAAEHPLFVAARQDPGSPWRDWFVWSQEAPQGWDIWGKNPWYHAAAEPWAFKGQPADLPAPPAGAQQHYFGTFGPHMPDFNLRRAEVWQYHLDSLRFWLNRGLDGFRLDAVPHMVETDAAQWNDQPESRRLTKALQDLAAGYARRWVVCEATAEPLAYASPEVCGAAFAFGYVEHYIKAARGEPDSVRAMVADEPRRSPRMATMLSNHDIFAGRRTWDQVEGDEARYRLAAASYLLQPGTPFIYYGEQIGQAGIDGLQGDLPIRGPMSWTADGQGFSSGRPFRAAAPNAASHNVAAQRHDPESLHAFYKAMLRLRHTRPSLAQGRWLGGDAQGLVAHWQQRHGHQRTLVVVNYGSAGAPSSLAGLPAGARLKALWPRWGAPARADAQGRAGIYMGPLSLRVYEVLP